MSPRKTHQAEDAVHPISASMRLQPLYPPTGHTVRRKKGGQTQTFMAKPIYKHMIWVIDDFLSPSECAAWVAYGERLGFEASQQAATRDTAFRDNGRAEVWCEDTAARIWQRLEPLLPEGIACGQAVGCYPKIRLYAYNVGQRFGKHIDEAVDASQGEITGVTVLIYLNDDGLEGGETVFYDGRRDERVAVSYKPKEGSLLFHGHGDMCLTHEAQAVRRGTKYVLRTDVTYAKKE